MNIIKELRTLLKLYVGPVSVRSKRSGWVYVRGSKFGGEFTPEEEQKLKELGLAVSPRLVLIGPRQAKKVLQVLKSSQKKGGLDGNAVAQKDQS